MIKIILDQKEKSYKSRKIFLSKSCVSQRVKYLKILIFLLLKLTRENFIRRYKIFSVMSKPTWLLIHGSIFGGVASILAIGRS